MSPDFGWSVFRCSVYFNLLLFQLAAEGAQVLSEESFGSYIWDPLYFTLHLNFFGRGKA